MNLLEMVQESERLSKHIDAGIKTLVDASVAMAHAERELRIGVARAWELAPKGTVPQREAWVESETADLNLTFSLAESQRYNALEAVRSRRAQLSALQSIMAAHRAEAELIH